MQIDQENEERRSQEAFQTYNSRGVKVKLVKIEFKNKNN